jgi:hypothetical protein
MHTFAVHQLLLATLHRLRLLLLLVMVVLRLTGIQAHLHAAQLSTGCCQALACCCQSQHRQSVCPRLLQLVGCQVHHVSCYKAAGLHCSQQRIVQLGAAAAGCQNTVQMAAHGDN